MNKTIKNSTPWRLVERRPVIWTVKPATPKAPPSVTVLQPTKRIAPAVMRPTNTDTETVYVQQAA